MDDLISRQTAIDALGERPMVWTSDDDYALGERNQYDIDRLAIETVPSADVQPVRHERWNKIDVSGLASCGCGYITDRYSVFNYCPHCGARMEQP